MGNKQVMSSIEDTVTSALSTLARYKKGIKNFGPSEVNGSDVDQYIRELERLGEELDSSEMEKALRRKARGQYSELDDAIYELERKLGALQMVSKGDDVSRAVKLIGETVDLWEQVELLRVEAADGERGKAAHMSWIPKRLRKQTQSKAARPARKTIDDSEDDGIDDREREKLAKTLEDVMTRIEATGKNLASDFIQAMRNENDAFVAVASRANERFDEYLQTLNELKDELETAIENLSDYEAGG